MSDTGARTSAGILESPGNVRLNGITIASYRLLGPFGGGEGLYHAIRIAERRPVLLLLAVSERAERPGGEPGSRLRRIALAASALGHPAIATVQEVGPAGEGRFFVALEAVDGETLEGRLVRGPLPLAETQDIALRLAEALARAHAEGAEGLVHGDLRPSCVLLTPEGPRIAAFGLGELLASGPAAAEGATIYRAPERIQGAPPSPAADVWSLGVLLYEMLTGRPPFSGADEEERAAAVLEASPAPLPGALRSIERVVLGALRKRPEERWANGAAILEALRAVPPGLGTGSELEPTLVDFPLQPGGTGPHRAQPGQRTGPEGLSARDLPSYRLGEVLGSGGMAVVYRAEDLRLGRTVALKFLAPELSRDPGAKRQFLREARAASALDHPNVCTIHEVGETGDGQIFLAMPWYDGETVRQRIQRGLLDPAEAVEIAIQVAQGLAKAHRLGIVHRDVKPANLMITKDGVVKILDFGLAQLAGGTGAQTGDPRGGTVAYMSPEQADGRGMDGRTDLWSLGVVLYEMLTGRKPFRGDREQGIFYSILHAEPEPMARSRPTPSDLPPELERIVARLLAKNREERYPDAETLLTDLRAVATEPRGSRSLLAPSRRAPSSRRRGLLVAVVLFLLIAGSVAFLVRSRGTAPGQGPVESDFTALTTEAGRETFPSVSPEGDFFVYAKTVDGDFDIFWQRAGGGNPQNLTNSPGPDTQPAISLDGEWIAFRSARQGGGLFLMGATGESVRRLTDFGFNPAWSPDGREIVFATEEVTGPGSRGSRSQLWIAEVATGATRRLEIGLETGLETSGDAVQPSWSPDGRRIAYWGVLAGTGRRAIWTVPAAGGEPLLAVDGGGAALLWSPAWAPDGRHLYFASDRGGAMGLWRVPIDQRSGRVRGEPRQVLAPATSSALPSLARDGGRIVFVSSEERANVVRIAFDPVRLETAGVLRPVTSGSRFVRSVHASPNDGLLVYATAAPQEDLFLIRPDGSGQEQLTDDPAKDRLPRWSADGRRIVFYSERGGEGYEAWAWTPDAPGVERLTALPGAVVEPLESPDGSLLVCGIDFSGPRLIDLRKPLAERTPRGLAIDSATGGEPLAFGVTSWSPDGSRLAGFDEQGRIVLYSFASRRAEVLPETGTNATWLRDGRSLLFLRDDAVWAIDVPSRRARKLLDPPDHSAFSWIALSPDERTLYLVHSTQEADIGMLTLK
jgi:serine/threonine protein kinase/Tol biopolymer transport system component